MSGWVPEDGWFGLFPGVTTINEAVAKLGQAEFDELLNARRYRFLGGQVTVTILTGESTISKVTVSSRFEKKELLPSTIEEARSMFGALQATGMDKVSGVTYERPGLRVVCDSGPDPAAVRQVEFYKPGP